MSAAVSMFLPSLLAQTASHPFEIIKVSAILDPEAPYNTAPLTDIAAFERGLVPRLVISVVTQAARTFLTPHVRAIADKIRPPSKDKDVHTTTLNRIINTLWEIAPHLIVVNIAGFLSCPLFLVSTIISQPGLSGNMSTQAIVQNIYQRHGIAGFWSGALPRFLSTSVYLVASTLGTKYFLKKLQEYSISKISSYQRAEQGVKLRNAQRISLIIAAIAGNQFASFLAMPFDTCAMELHAAAILKGSLPSTTTVASFLISKYGFKLFTIGLLPQIIKHLVYSTVSTFFIIRRNP